MNKNPSVVLYGLDLAKSVFQLTGVDGNGKPVIRKRFRRKQVLEYFSNHPKVQIAMEACPGAHWMANKLSGM